MAFSLKAVFGMDATGVKTELKQLRKEVNDTAQKFAKIGVVAVSAAFVKFGKDAIDLARNLKDTANSLTITTDELQALQFQASQNSVKTEQFNASLAKLRVQTIEAAQGNETMRKSFEALGLDAEKLLRLPLAQQYEAVAVGFASAADQGRALHAVSKIFGEGTGPKMAGALRDLAQNGLPAVIEQAREAGRVLNEETIEGLDRAADAIDDWKRRITVAVGNILVNFRTEEGLKALGFGLLEQAARFGGRIIDALAQANDLAGAVFKGTFAGVANWFRDKLVDVVQSIGESLNKILPDRFEINIAGLDQFRSDGDYVAASIHEAIAQTKPTAFADEWGNFWKVQREEAQAAADALNKSEFAKDIREFKDSGAPIRKEIEQAASAVDQAGMNAGGEIKDGAKQILTAGEATARGLDGVANKLKQAAAQIDGALLKSMYGSRYSEDQISNASDEALKAIVTRSRAEAQEALRREWMSPNVLNARGTSQGVLQARNTANAAEQELAFRSGIRGLYERGGAAAVYGSGQYDPIAVDNLLAKYTDAIPIQEQQLTALERIQQGLARAGLIRPTG